MARRPNPIRQGFFNSPGFAQGAANIASLFAPVPQSAVPAVNPAQVAQAEKAMAESRLLAAESQMNRDLSTLFRRQESGQPVDLGAVGATIAGGGGDPEIAALANLFTLSPEQRMQVQLTARGPINEDEFLTLEAKEAAREAALANELEQTAMQQAGQTARTQMTLDAEAAIRAAQVAELEAKTAAAGRFTTPGGSRTSVMTPEGEAREIVSIAEPFAEAQTALAEQRRRAQRFISSDVGIVDIGDPDNPEVVINAPGAEIGGLTSSQRGKQLADLQEREIALETARATANDLKRLITENPASIGAAGSFSRGATSMIAQAQNFANLMGFDISASLNPEEYNDAFKRAKDKNISPVEKAALDSAVVRSNVTSLAYAAAAASGQTGRDVSNRDVERFIEEIGASTGNPEAFSLVLDDFVGRLERNLRIREQVLNRRTERSITEPSAVIDYDAQGNRIGESIE